MKKYFRGFIQLPFEKAFPGVTEKAVQVTIAGGSTCANDWHEWFPKSQLIIGEPNNIGWAEVLIPFWIIKQKTNMPPRDYFRRIREIELDGADIVER